MEMTSWLTFHWMDLVVSFSFGVLCSFVRRILPRFLLSTALALCVYWVLVRAVAHAGARWNNEIAAAMVLGTGVGSLVRPAAIFLFRAVKDLLSRA
jgi:hypothetical protein